MILRKVIFLLSDILLLVGLLTSLFMGFKVIRNSAEIKKLEASSVRQDYNRAQELQKRLDSLTHAK
ncbi:MAG: hypothetical protein NTW18_00515 [Candidatus Omnitrophica bacterium]|nr:hypothetical protein [Candidatus Omnitrophota bacterium]